MSNLVTKCLVRVVEKLKCPLWYVLVPLTSISLHNSALRVADFFETLGRFVDATFSALSPEIPMACWDFSRSGIFPPKLDFSLWDYP
jgi:hypothetical protein